MKSAKTYVDLDGTEIGLGNLDADESRLLALVRRRYRSRPDWTEFESFWLRTVADFYDRRGLSRPQIRQTAIYKVAQDLGDRLGLAAGLIRPDDYREELEELIRTKFRTPQTFCQAAGISSVQLEDVLSGNKDLGLSTLTRALGQIGYALHITPSKRRKTG